MSIFTLTQTAAGLWAPRFTGSFTSNGTTTIVGDGTEFASSLVGMTFRFVGGSIDYTIASVTDATHLTTTGNVPAGSGQVAFLSSNQLGLIDANFHLLGSAALADDGDFQPYNANTTLLGNTTTGAGSIVLASSPTLTTPTIASLIGSKIYPAADSTTAIQICKADGSTVIGTFDTTNLRFGIGTTAPNATFEAVGDTFPVGQFVRQTTTNNSILSTLGVALKNTAGDPAAGFGPGFIFKAQDNEGNSDNVAAMYGILETWTNGTNNIGTGGFQICVFNNSGSPTAAIAARSTGKVGFGTPDPSARIESLSTTEQLRLSHDSTHYASFTVDATGLLTLGGTLGIIKVSQYRLAASNTAPASAAATGTAGEIRFCADGVYFCTATDTWVKATMATW